jgi:hypothetical protein
MFTKQCCCYLEVRYELLSAKVGIQHVPFSVLLPSSLLFLSACQSRNDGITSLNIVMCLPVFWLMGEIINFDVARKSREKRNV